MWFRSYLNGLVAFPTFFNLSLNLAKRSSWSEPLSSAKSAPSLAFADCTELLHHSKRLSCTHILFLILFYDGFSQDIEHSSLRCTVLMLSRPTGSDSLWLCGLIHSMHNNLLLLIPSSQSFPSPASSFYASSNPQEHGFLLTVYLWRTQSIWAVWIWLSAYMWYDSSCSSDLYILCRLLAGSRLLDSGFPGISVVKESACNTGDSSSIPGLGRSAGEGIGYPLQYSWASLMVQLVKNPSTMRVDLGSIPGLGRSHG